MRLLLVGLAIVVGLAMMPAVAAIPELAPVAANPTVQRAVVAAYGAGNAILAAMVGGLFFAIGGLRHVDRENVLEHPMRQSLLQTVTDSPGIHLRELAGRHGTAVTNTQWHLRKLELAGLVKTQKVQGRRLYYPVAGGMATKQQAFQNAALQNPNAARLTNYLESHGGCNQHHLSEALGMNPGTVRWHLRRLQESGLVRSIEEGAQTRYFVMRPADRPGRPPVRTGVPGEVAVGADGK